MLIEMKRFLQSAIVAFLAFLAVSCEPEQPMNFMISLKTSVEYTPGMEIESTFFKGKGPLATDKVCLVEKNGSKSFEYPIKKLGEDSFTFVLGSDFEEGIYMFNIKRGSEVKEIGTVTYTLKRTSEFDLNGDTTVYGIVSCDGTPIKDVVVSDGYEVVMTDSKGLYQIRSVKKNAYVFISIPSGYAVPSDGVLPQFYKRLSKPQSVAERVDFSLSPAGDQTNHKMLFFGDIHLADKQKDRSQFATFTNEVKQYVASIPSEKVYALTLGDMTWDLYWYDHNYCFPQYLLDIKPLAGMQVFQTIGNHDHNMRTSVDGSSAGWDAVDWDTAGRFRQDIGPNYYSFNIGKVHYVVLDDIYCTNTTGGASADRIYKDKVSSDCLKWLKKDLSHVSASTPVVVTMHAPLYAMNEGNSLDNASELTSCFNGYSYVRFVTGHSHKMWTVDKNNIHEHNNGAVCAAWWWAGYYTPTLNIGQDGAPAGYRVMDWTGTTETSYFKATGRDASYQFRAYDRNVINIQPATYGVTKNVDAFRTYVSSNGGYDVASSANEVIINVWDYNPKWKISVTEEGKSLSVSRITGFDPLFIITYLAPRFNSTASPSFTGTSTNHLFKVKASSPTSTLEINVTDDEGRTYSETMKRPRQFTVDTYK